MNPIRHGPVEIRLNDDGSLDELVLQDDVTGLFAHLEQLETGHWYLSMGRQWVTPEVGWDSVTVWLDSHDKITATWEKS